MYMLQKLQFAEDKGIYAVLKREIYSILPLTFYFDFNLKGTIDFFTVSA